MKMSQIVMELAIWKVHAYPFCQQLKVLSVRVHDSNVDGDCEL
jgi:hypothetical protein